MTVWKQKILALGIAGALAVGSTAVQAKGLMDRATGDGLNVAFYNFKPYAYVDENGELTGTDVDTLRAVLGKLGGQIADAKAIEWGRIDPGRQVEPLRRRRRRHVRDAETMRRSSFLGTHFRNPANPDRDERQPARRNRL